MTTQELTLTINFKDGQVTGGVVNPLAKVPVRRYFQLIQVGAVKVKPLDLDATDSSGNLIHFPLTVWEGEETLLLSNHEEVKAWLSNKYDDPELEPGPLEWLPNVDQYVQQLSTSKTVPSQVTEYVSSAAVATMMMQDEMLLVDETGKVVSVIDPKTNKPRDGEIHCEGFNGTVGEFTLWLNQKYPIADQVFNFNIHRLLRPSGAIEEICYRHVYGKHLGQTPETFEIEFVPESTEPEAEHQVRRAYVVGPDNQLVSFNPVPGTEIDWLPIVLIDKPGFAQTVRGLHGNDDAPGIIQALMDFDPPKEDYATDPKYHWRFAGNGLWFEAMRPGGGVLELRATYILWDEDELEKLA